jgi:hypothetical protein
MTGHLIANLMVENRLNIDLELLLTALEFWTTV